MAILYARSQVINQDMHCWDLTRRKKLRFKVQRPTLFSTCLDLHQNSKRLSSEPTPCLTYLKTRMWKVSSFFRRVSPYARYCRKKPIAFNFNRKHCNTNTSKCKSLLVIIGLLLQFQEQLT